VHPPTGDLQTLSEPVSYVKMDSVLKQYSLKKAHDHKLHIDSKCLALMIFVIMYDPCKKYLQNATATVVNLKIACT
jgi:hypothetical protein